jgi:Flp pilus assembly pilin Flp
MSRNCNPRWKDPGTSEWEQGQTMAEYGVVLAVITVAVVAVFAPLLADAVVASIDRVVDILTGVVSDS